MFKEYTNGKWSESGEARGRRVEGGGVEIPSRCSVKCPSSWCRTGRFKCSSTSNLMRHDSAFLHLIKAMIHFSYATQSTVHLAARNTLSPSLFAHVYRAYALYAALCWLSKSSAPHRAQLLYLIPKLTHWLSKDKDSRHTGKHVCIHLLSCPGEAAGVTVCLVGHLEHRHRPTHTPLAPCTPG